MRHIRLVAAAASVFSWVVHPAFSGGAAAQQPAQPPQGAFQGYGSLAEWLGNGVEAPPKPASKPRRDHAPKAARQVIQPAAYAERKSAGKDLKGEDTARIVRRKPEAEAGLSKGARQNGEIEHPHPAAPKAVMQKIRSQRQQRATAQVAKGTSAETTGSTSSVPIQQSSDVIASFTNREWWQPQGRPAVVRLRDCVASYGARQAQPGPDEKWSALLIGAIETDCQPAFDALMQTLAQKAEADDVERVMRALTETIFLPALKTAPIAAR
jgi:hypothetical protein